MSKNSKTKTAAILFADIVGYTAFVQKNEEQALSQLQHFKQALERVVPSCQGCTFPFYGVGCLVILDHAKQVVTCAKFSFSERFQFKNVMIASLINRLITTAILLLICNTSYAIENPIDSIKEQLAFDSIQTVFQKIQRYQKIVITTNFDTLTANRRTVAEQAATLVLSGEGESEIEFNIQIKPRGRLRRMKCELPPIRLNFNKSDLNSLQLYEEYDKLKLVTHCGDAGKNAQVLLKEYWTYKLYNEVTPQSFRVHVLEVSYVHETDPSRRIDSYAVIIENEAEMAHRLNGELIEEGLRSTDLTTLSYHNVLLFNYMIGNTDWKLATQKNLKAVRLRGDSLYTLVPYDFDYAKLVNAPYMRRSQHIPNLDDDNRAVIGTVLDRNALLKSIELFKSLKKEGFQCYKKCAILKQKEKAYMTYFINSFFQTIKRKNKIEDIFFPIQIESK